MIGPHMWGVASPSVVTGPPRHSNKQLFSDWRDDAVEKDSLGSQVCVTSQQRHVPVSVSTTEPQFAQMSEGS